MMHKGKHRTNSPVFEYQAIAEKVLMRELQQQADSEIAAEKNKRTQSDVECSGRVEL
jgi:hypothetical protein